MTTVTIALWRVFLGDLTSSLSLSSRSVFVGFLLGGGVFLGLVALLTYLIVRMTMLGMYHGSSEASEKCNVRLGCETFWQ